ncbi:regulator of telomere elongation helicase 1 isoform X2 [Clupea harengus]|nr:regulator of telomere elongation helicase 1 isoform X2 [Clupea harengus]
MPYNYLLDPKSRRAHNIELQGAVVIFDEAHNVEKMCEEATSFDLTPFDLSSALQAVDKVLHEQAVDAGKGEDFSESSSSELKLDIQSVAKIKQIIMDLEMNVNSYEISPNSQGITKPGSFIYEIFQKAQVTFDTKTAVVETMDQITGYLSSQPGIFLNTSGLQKLSDIIQLVFPGNPAEGSSVPLEQGTQQFKVHIHADTSNSRKKQTADVWAPSSSKKQGNILSYWCFSPGFSMQELVRQQVRSIILTSGTLSPLSSFTAEMQIPFQVSLENPHVIQRDQIFVSVIDKGPDGTLLSSAYDRRFLPENMASLGNTVVNLSRVVPEGMLVFFPSYTIMDKTLEFWRGNGQADRIENIKPMFVEPRGKGTFNEVIDGYYERVNEGRGGSFFAVCRGKASEGLDFANSYGRGVVITGLPFPPRMDPRVTLKMQYLEEMGRQRKAGVKYLSGQEWYRQQASRAVNQAIGRVIRHRDDYGAIFLCDKRFKGTEARAQLPSWVRPYVKVYDSFGCVVRDAAQFFRVAQKLRPPPEKKHTPLPISSGLCGGGTSGGVAELCRGGGGASCSSQKAKTLDSHVPSLKRRREDDTEVGGGVARLCVQYETELPATQKRARGLLDALEQSDHTGHTQQDANTQDKEEERPSDVMRGSKRKIRLVQRPVAPEPQRSEVTGSWKGHDFLLELKRNLSQENFTRLMEALKVYKESDDLLDFIAKAAAMLTSDPNTHRLLRGLYQAVRPHHKKRFHEQCVLLTGQGCIHVVSVCVCVCVCACVCVCVCVCALIGLYQAVRPHHKKRFHEQCVLLTGEGCGYKAEHSLTREQRRALTTHTDSETSSGPEEVAVSSEPAALMSDVQKALGADKSKQLFSCLSAYRKNQQYDQMVTSVVSLLTERDEHLQLLKRLEVFIPTSDRSRFREMTSSLTGGSHNQDNQPSASSETKGKSQPKISAFFTGPS